MKETLVKVMLGSVIFFGACFSASAQLYVTVRPIAPTIVMTERPSPTHVWISEEWNENGGSYRYTGGHWENPPHHGDHWNQGHWDHDKNHGDHWTRGSWQGEERKRK